MMQRLSTHARRVAVDAYPSSLLVLFDSRCARIRYLAAAWFAILSNTSFALNFVFYNSYLPILVNIHPDVTNAASERKSRVKDEIQSFMSTVGFIAGDVMRTAYNEPKPLNPNP